MSGRNLDSTCVAGGRPEVRLVRSWGLGATETRGTVVSREPLRTILLVRGEYLVKKGGFVVCYARVYSFLVFVSLAQSDKVKTTLTRSLVRSPP